MSIETKSRTVERVRLLQECHEYMSLFLSTGLETDVDEAAAWMVDARKLSYGQLVSFHHAMQIRASIELPKDSRPKMVVQQCPHGLAAQGCFTCHLLAEVKDIHDKMDDLYLRVCPVAFGSDGQPELEFKVEIALNSAKKILRKLLQKYEVPNTRPQGEVNAD